MPVPIVHCTHKLATFLGVKPGPLPTDGDTWNANLFACNGRKCLIIVNAHTCYALLSLDVRKAMLTDLPAFFRDLLAEQLITEWPEHADAIAGYLTDVPAAVVARTNNDKRTLGVMNTYVDTLRYVLSDHEDPLSTRTSRLEAWRMNDSIVSAPKDAPKGPGSWWEHTVFPADRMAARIGIPHDRRAYGDRMSMELHGRQRPRPTGLG